MNNDQLINAIEKIWNDNQSIINNHNKGLEAIRKQETSLEQRKQTTEIAISRAERRAETIRKYHVMMTQPTRNIQKLHERMIRLRQQSLRENITIAKKKEIDKDLSKLKEDLQKTCDHALLIELDGWEGSYSYDFDDAYPEVRICVICQYRDSRYVGCSQQGEYKSLKSQAGRAIFEGKRSSKTRDHVFNFYQPLSEIKASLLNPELKELQEEIEQYISSQSPS